MNVIRKLTIIAMFFVLWILFIFLGVMIGLAFGDSPMPIAELFVGFLGGLVLGTPLAMVSSELFGKYVWPAEKGGIASIRESNNGRQEWEEEMHHPEVERQRVEK